VLCGEHDAATSEEIEAAVAAVDGNLLIDLTQCEFIDSTVIGVVMAKSKALGRDGHQLALVAPPPDRVAPDARPTDWSSWCHEREPSATARRAATPVDQWASDGGAPRA
jgi:hypothetical protein